ncbi:MAG TPA: PKD domain-containing protein, partial [Roseiflexaceae bacterium]
VRAGGPSADLDSLAAASQLSPETVEDALARMIALRLANVQAGRYSVYSSGLRRVLARILPRGAERSRAAAFLAGAAALHVGDMAWLGREWINLLSAARESLLAGNPAQAGALIRAVQPHLVLQGLWGTWGRLIDLAEQSSAGDAALRAWALHERGTRAGLLGDLAAAATHLAEARRLRLELGDQTGADATLHNMEYLGVLPPPPGPAPASERAIRLLAGWHFALLLALGLMAVVGVGAAVAILARAGAPAAHFTVTPTSGSYPLRVTFDAGDPGGSGKDAALTYIWDFGDGAPVLTTSASVATHTYARVGSYHPTLQLLDDRGRHSNAFAATIVVENATPRPEIELPAAETHFQSDQALTLRGVAGDREDGRLPDAALEWTVLLHHGAGVDTILGPVHGNRLSLVAPALKDLDAAATSYLEIRLRAADSQGATGLVTRELRPQLDRVTFTTEPAGLQLSVNGQPIDAPSTVQVWHGATLTIGAPEQLDQSGHSLALESWSDGRTRRHRRSSCGSSTIV